MATLNPGATSLAAANWSDATGFADNAQLYINDVFNIPASDGSLDQSGLTTGIDFLKILPGAQGTLGGGGNALRVDADSASTDAVINEGNVELYLRGGATPLIQNFHNGGRGRSYLVDDDFNNVTCSGGSIEVYEDADISTLLQVTGGSVTVEYNANALPTIRVTGGTVTIRRGYTNLYISGGTVLDDRGTGTGANVHVFGGRYIPMRGDSTNVNGHGGIIDLSRANEEFQLGTSTLAVAGSRIIDNSLVDTSNLASIGAYVRQDAPNFV